ncbi:hypothetical protein GCM10027093_22510 [Paraburkholderia jirisanensis]
MGFAQTRQPEPERRIGPGGCPRPAKAEQPGQAHYQQHEHGERRAEVSEHMPEQPGKRVTNMIDPVEIQQRRLERATGHEYADKAKPQADRAGPTQAGAARQHGSRKAPEKREKPDRRAAEPAENYRMHALHINE